MADDRLRIVASIEDQFTGPLAKLKTGLAGVGEETKKNANSWKSDWDGVRASAEKYRGVLGDFSPILSKIGVGGMGAALSLGGVAVALERFAGSTRGLSLMAKDIGMTVDQLRAFQGLGEKFGVTADTMKGAAKNFNDEMRNIRNHGSEYMELQAMNLGKLAEDVASAGNMQQAIERAIDGLAKIPDPVIRRRVSRMFFGTDDLAIVASNITEPAKAALQATQQQLGEINKATEEAAKRFEGALNRAGNAFERLKIMALSPVLGGAASVMDGVADSIETDPNDPKSRLKYLRKRKVELDEQIKALPEISGKRSYFENNRAGILDEIKKLEEAVARGAEKGVDRAMQKRREDGAPTVQQQSFGGTGPLGGNGSLIQKAAWGGFGGPLGGSAGSGPLGGGSSGGGVSPNAPVPHGQQIDRDLPELGDGIRGRPFSKKGDGAAIPKDAGANPGAYKAVLDHIADSEGTINHPKASGYNTSLGYGKFLPGGKEQNLTGMTLDEISALGRHMRRQPGNPNSSALGRYQIVGDTMRRLMKRMGLKGGELFDEKMQDRMAAELARDTRGDPRRLRNEWASLTGWRNSKAAELLGQVDRNASTMPEDAPAVTTKGPLADPAGPLSTPKAEAPEAEGAPEPTDGRGVNADLIKVLKRAQALSKVKFHIHEGLRTLERQREMVRRGWSKTMDSEHLKGRAVDVRADGDPAVGALDRKKYEAIADAMRQASEEAGIPVEWGGDWKKFKDVPHFQFPKGYRARPNAYAGDAPAARPRAEGAPGVKLPGAGSGGKGTLHIKVDAPPGTHVRHDVGELFRETEVFHNRVQMDMKRA